MTETGIVQKRSYYVANKSGSEILLKIVHYIAFVVEWKYVKLIRRTI